MKVNKRLLLTGLLLALTLFMSGCSAVLTVDNQSPTANFSASKENGEAPLTVTFDASNSSDNSAIIDYQWDFGDGTEGTRRVVTHTFGDDGNYYVQLTVTDDSGYTNSTTTSIKVSNPAPQAEFSHYPEIPLRGDVVEFDAGQTFDPASEIKPQYVTSFRWNFGDGTQKTGKVVQKVYNQAGFYDVQLEVMDDDGAIDVRTRQIEIEAPPNANFELKLQKVTCNGVPGDNSSQLVPIKCHAKIRFDARKSNDPQGEIVDYYWELSNRSTFTGRSFAVWLPWDTATNKVANKIDITLTVTDDHGLTDSITRQIGE